jgi:hypothetical protein
MASLSAMAASKWSYAKSSGFASFPVNKKMPTGTRSPPAVVGRLRRAVASVTPMATKVEENGGPVGGPPLRSLSIGWGIALVLLSFVAFVLGAVVFAAMDPAHTNLVSLQWAGSASAAREVVGGRTSDFRSGLSWDFLLIATYTVSLVVACCLGRLIFCTSAPWRWCLFGLVATILAATLNIAQDILLLVGLNDTSGTWVFRLAATASFLKFSALLAAAPIAVGALVTAATRLITHRGTARRWEAAGELREKSSDPLFVPPPPVEWREHMRGCRPDELDRSIDRSWWARPQRDGASAHFDQNLSLPQATQERGTGICVSGGGVRSATVTLGALQGLRAAQPLNVVNELVSVSGGGYMAGGFQLALTGEKGADADGISAADVFAPGSPEEDHLRRHSSYLSDGPGQWAVALGVIFRNLLASLVVLGLFVTTVGIAIGRFYRFVPIVKGGLESLPIAPFAQPGAATPPYPGVPWAVTLGVVTVAALAVALYGFELFWAAMKGKRPMPVVRLAIAATWGAILVLTVGIVIPALVWVSSWVTYEIGFTSRPGVAVGSLSVIVSFVGALAATLWRSKQRVGSLFSSGTRAVKSVLPNSMVQMIIIWIALVVLTLAVFLAAGWVATSGLDDSWWALAVVIPLALLAVFLDQTSMSLHPFYRRRLASAFAVRRRCEGGIAMAEPYEYSEGTPLSAYGKKRPDFPRVAFAAAANLTGQDRTPPGRRSVSFALGADYVGGPQVGWVRSDYLEALSSQVVSHDLTVEAAVAISGAAFASAMGGQTRFYELFLSLVNLRLGAWLPNPYFVALKAAHPNDWTVPGLPRIRRLDYFGREILGVHRSTARMLLCTDGGHYDNLGLVELLRRKCAYIYCFDASGASPPLAGTLAEAITLAREELGVEILLNEPYTLVAGGGTAIDPQGPLATLNGRLSATSVITATIQYPKGEQGQPADGLLIFAQVNLTPDIPYEILDFTRPDPGFPNDGTADQWFDASRFDAYQRLGLYLGSEVAKTRGVLKWLNVKASPSASADRAPRASGGPKRAGFRRPRVQDTT